MNGREKSHEMKQRQRFEEGQMTGRGGMSTIDPWGQRRGFALPVAVFAMVIVGVLVTGGFYIAGQESRVGIASSHGTEAFYHAEVALTEVIGNSNFRHYARDLAIGDSALVNRTHADVNTRVAVTRVGENLYFLAAQSTLTKGGAVYSGATRRIGTTVRLETANIDPPAALTTRGNVNLVGSAEITGADTDPSGWDDCDYGVDNKPGIMHDGSGTVTTSGGATFSGSPAQTVDPSIDEQTFTQFGDLSWDDLVAMANIRFPGGNINTTGPRLTADGRCDEGHNLNWGDPGAQVPKPPCGDYFPIIHVAGNARIQSGGIGQGILLVDGDLDLRGNFVFYGIIIVQGAFQTQGGGNRIVGGVMAANATLDNTQQMSGSSVVQNSNCSASHAVIKNARLTRARALEQRSWVDLSAIEL